MEAIAELRVAFGRLDENAKSFAELTDESKARWFNGQPADPDEFLDFLSQEQQSINSQFERIAHQIPDVRLKELLVTRREALARAARRGSRGTVMPDGTECVDLDAEDIAGIQTMVEIDRMIRARLAVIAGRETPPANAEGGRDAG